MTGLGVSFAASTPVGATVVMVNLALFLLASLTAAIRRR